MTGEYADRDFITTRGDARAVLTLPRDSETVKLGRNNRFLVDDYGPNHVLAYRLTKPFRMSSLYNGDGIYSFVLTECNTEDTDNFDLHIANYYKYFPRPDKCKEDEKYDPSPILPDVKEEDEASQEEQERTDDAERKVWF